MFFILLQAFIEIEFYDTYNKSKKTFLNYSTSNIIVKIYSLNLITHYVCRAMAIYNLFIKKYKLYCWYGSDAVG
jgi:hypothetical protein